LRTLRAEGVEVRFGARVTRLWIHSELVTTFELMDGERTVLAPEDLVVSALPWFVLRDLLPHALPQLGEVASSPIVSAYFETAVGAPPLPDEGAVVALVDGDPFHFVLRTPGGDARRFALLSGGGRVFDGMAVEAIAELARSQIERHYAGWTGARGAVVRVRKEQHATFVAGPGARAWRPVPGRVAGAPLNLLVCGDWTDTGLPATLEGAVRSAEQLLRGLDGGQ
jgi:hypothetical protein